MPRRRGRAIVAARNHVCAVKTFLTVLIIILMVATLGVLFAGLIGLARPGHDPARSNRLMRWRVILQGTVILLFMILMSLLRS
ncbi:MAG TPA: twin transmembrane helix small protein [Acetobacteraceae bacterium]|nr:twin transmembrane helix small protein [Acetobacteraceae bacterium]